MIPSVAFVGAGPTTIYTLAALLNHAVHPFRLTILEAQANAGRGTPYRPGWNDPAMLSNIASIEIPPLAQSLTDWLHGQTDQRLAALGIARANIDARTFYSRLTLGEFFADQLQALLDRARQRGIGAEVRTNCQVIDAVSDDDGMTLIVQTRGKLFEQRFDHVVVATGHQWPKQPEARRGYFLSPWPASALDTVAACSVGIRGSSLTAIDAVMALAVRHGAFVDGVDGSLRYQPAPDTAAFHLTMISRKGLLPEADFYFPIPYQKLSICTPDAIAALIESDDADMLDQAFALFKQELAASDPSYANSIGLDHLTLENFCDRYFADRMAADPFEWARQNLIEAEQNYAACRIVPWRYAILRMHEVIELLVPHLEQRDFLRFSRSFKPVFVDDYATVPHTSIKRLLALHEAGVLSVLAVGNTYHIDSGQQHSGAVLHHGAQRTHFPVFIEATGQRALLAKDFPFPSLIRQGIIRDEPAPKASGLSRGIVIDDQFHPVADSIPADQLFCLSLPFILGRHPFIQGITSSHEMGEVVGRQLAAAIDRATDRHAVMPPAAPEVATP